VTNEGHTLYATTILGLAPIGEHEKKKGGCRQTVRLVFDEAHHPAQDAAAVCVGSSGGQSVAAGRRFFVSLCRSRPQAPLTDVISDETLQQLAAQVGVKLDESCMVALRDIADDFVESVTVFAAEISKHARSDAITVKDVQLHLEQNWGLSLPLPSKRAKTDSSATEEEVSAPPAPAVTTASAAPSAPPAATVSPTAGNAPTMVTPPTIVGPPVAGAPESMARMPAHAQRLALKQRLSQATPSLMQQPK
jgi:histone H3/H4